MVGRQGLSHRRGHNIGGSEVGHVQMIRQRDDSDQGAPKKIWWMKCHTLGNHINQSKTRRVWPDWETCKCWVNPDHVSTSYQGS